MNKATRLVADGTVRFSVAKKPPQWPAVCVVCGVSCAETWGLWSKTLEPTGRGDRVVNGALKFEIPLHVTSDACYSSFDRPIPLRLMSWAALASVAMGGLTLAVIRPAPADLWTTFAFFAILAAVVAMVAIKVRCPPYLEIWQKDASEYTAAFRKASLAQKFVDLNRDIVLPWTRPKWLDPFVKWH